MMEGDMGIVTEGVPFENGDDVDGMIMDGLNSYELQNKFNYISSAFQINTLTLPYQFHSKL